MAAVKLFVCFCSVRGFKEEESREKLNSVLFCLINSKSVLFNLLCAFDLSFFFRMPAVNSVSDLFVCLSVVTV